jgi:hypothetical protein
MRAQHAVPDALSPIRISLDRSKLVASVSAFGLRHINFAWKFCTIVWKCKYAASPIAQLEITDANGVSLKREVAWVVKVHSIFTCHRGEAGIEYKRATFPLSSTSIVSIQISHIIRTSSQFPQNKSLNRNSVIGRPPQKVTVFVSRGSSPQAALYHAPSAQNEPIAVALALYINNSNRFHRSIATSSTVMPSRSRNILKRFPEEIIIQILELLCLDIVLSLLNRRCRTPSTMSTLLCRPKSLLQSPPRLSSIPHPPNLLSANQRRTNPPKTHRPSNDMFVNLPRCPRTRTPRRPT